MLYRLSAMNKQRKNTNQTVDKNFIWPYFRLTEVNADIISSVMIW
jgi:hypothetical protein